METRQRTKKQMHLSRLFVLRVIQGSGCGHDSAFHAEAPGAVAFFICSNIINTGLFFFITSIDAVFIANPKLNKPPQLDFAHTAQTDKES